MISPHFQMLLARARLHDLRRARGPRTHEAEPPTKSAGDVTLRLASAADQTPLSRLAALDSARPPAEPVLLALLDGEPVAALSLRDGTHLSDPFRRTVELIDLLRARARQLKSDRRSPGSRAAPRSATTRTSTENPGGQA
jgi:hypothetical protein